MKESNTSLVIPGKSLHNINIMSMKKNYLEIKKHSWRFHQLFCNNYHLWRYQVTNTEIFSSKCTYYYHKPWYQICILKIKSRFLYHKNFTPQPASEAGEAKCNFILTYRVLLSLICLIIMVWYTFSNRKQAETSRKTS